MSYDIKNEFGRRFREARDAKKLSRAALGLRLGISPKTIQSWEMGRTFIEDLSLIPAIEAELGISISSLIDRSIKKSEGVAVAAEPAAEYGRGGRKPSHPVAGPVAVRFDLRVPDREGLLPDPSKLGDAAVAVPLLKPRSADKAVADLEAKDVARYVVIPGDWPPRGGVLVAFRMADSSMTPMIPLDATVVVDRRPISPRKALNRVVALYLQKKGLRIRRFIEDPVSRQPMGMPALEGMRGKAPFRPQEGDEILGRVVGILSQPTE